MALLRFLIGLALLLGAVITNILPLSVLGFVQMLVSLTYVVSWWDKAPSAPSDAAAAAGSGPSGSSGLKAGKPKKAGFMDGVEERWRRRREEGGR